MSDYIDRQAAIDALCNVGCGSGYCGIACDEVKAIEQLPSVNVKPVVHCIDCITDETAQKIIEEAKSLELRCCNKLGWAYCNGNCDECSTTVTTMNIIPQYNMQKREVK